jgi:hypothetical protein
MTTEGDVMQEFDKLIDAGPHLLDLDGLLDRVEIVAHVVAEILAARLELLEIAIVFVGVHFRERRARQLFVDCAQRGSKQLRRRMGERVSLARCAELLWCRAAFPVSRLYYLLRLLPPDLASTGSLNDFASLSGVKNCKFS